VYTALEAGGYPLIDVGYRCLSGYQEAPLLAAIRESENAGARR